MLLKQFPRRLPLSPRSLPDKIDILQPHFQKSSFHKPATIEAFNSAFFDGSASPLPSTHPLAHIRLDLISRPTVFIPDFPQKIPSSLLCSTLSDFLPKNSQEILTKRHGLNNSAPSGHHLVYFPPPDPLSKLLPDGTDPAHSPGEPFNRRMWAGGFIHFYQNLPLNCKLQHLVEKIAGVEVKGQEGEEKVFVRLKRSIVEDDTNPSILEGRTLVFMRDRPSGASKPRSKVTKPPTGAHFSHTLTPTPGLLFRFSALTFNAHRIHLDKQYCQQVEGHRNLLVHGPLSLVLMLELLQGHLGDSSERIVRVEYRNLAPLYAEEEMTVCGKQKHRGEYEVWIEGSEGGLAVKGTVMTETT